MVALGLILLVDAVDDGLDLAGVLLSSTAIGSGVGITIGVLEERSLEEIEQWGFRGTAVGFLFGTLFTFCVATAPL